MEILIFVLVLSNLNLVLTEDVAIDNTALIKNNHKAPTAQEENHFLNDQIAESSQSITQEYGKAAVNDGHKETQGEIQNQVHPPHATDGFRHNAVVLSPIRVLQPGIHQGYFQPQQMEPLYMHPLQQTQTFGAEALPLLQTHDDQGPQGLGYSSYVEHLSEKDEDEIKSALKDGSMSDIKRIVPKSGITFKIYQKNKSQEKQKLELQSNPTVHFNSKSPGDFSVHHHRIRSELPLSPLRQAEVYQSTAPFSNDNGEKHHDSDYSQRLFQSLGQNEQDGNVQSVYYTKSAQGTSSEVNGKSSSYAKPHFKINVAESNYNQQRAGVELQSSLKPSSKNFQQSFPDFIRQKQWNFSGKIDGFQRKVKPMKALHHVSDPLILTDNNKELPYTHHHENSPVGHNFSGHKLDNSLVETTKYNSGNYLSNSKVAKTNQNNFVGQSASATQTDQKLAFNKLSGNYVNGEGIKSQHIAHLGTTAHTEHFFKDGSSHTGDSETAKSDEHVLISNIPKSSYIEIKNSQNFDHQKALEDSTPFDIKNAIDNSESFLRQTNYIHPTTVIHPLDNVQTKQLTYIVPKTPTSTLVTDNSIHDTVAEGHQIKGFGHAGVSPEVAHPTVPQTFLWTSQHPKQGNVLVSKDLHQQLLRLPLPIDEIYVKTPSVEFPLSVVSHVSLPQKKQPLAFHHDFPVVKDFPQELYFQPKPKVRVQPNQINHFKLAQPVTIDWSLFKSSGLSNFDTNALGMKPELVSYVKEPGKKKIVPILVRKRKNRSNTKHEIGVVYGKVSGSRRPTKPNYRQEKNVRGNALKEVNSSIRQQEAKEEKKNEFSVSASYKVDRSSKSS